MFSTSIIARLTRAGLVLALLVAVVFQTACGTILHPERKGQPAGRIDPAIAILDGLGLLLFVIPGIIAFAVDFGNGTIYLPPEESSANGEPSTAEARKIHVNPDKLTRQKLASVIEKHTGRSVTLTERDMRVLRQQDSQAAMKQIIERSQQP